jgi:hypothetical protein
LLNNNFKRVSRRVSSIVNPYSDLLRHDIDAIVCLDGSNFDVISYSNIDNESIKTLIKVERSGYFCVEGHKLIVVNTEHDWKYGLLILELIIRKAFALKFGAMLIHGGALKVGGGALLVLGSGGGGKTKTLIESAISLGGVILGDDRVWLTKRNEVMPFVRYMVIKDNDATLVKGLIGKFDYWKLVFSSVFLSSLNLVFFKKVYNYMMSAPISIFPSNHGLGGLMYRGSMEARFQINEVLRVNGDKKIKFDCLEKDTLFFLMQESKIEWNDIIESRIDSGNCRHQEIDIAQIFECVIDFESNFYESVCKA